MDFEESKPISNSVGTQASSVQNLGSPEMFDSDSDNEAAVENIEMPSPAALPNTRPQKLSSADLIARSDNYLLARINKFLSGVPPPPRLTICRSDCNDFLSMIHQNCSLFSTKCCTPADNATLDQITSECFGAKLHGDVADNRHVLRAKNTSRNLTSAFDACDTIVKQKNTDPTRNSTDDRDAAKMKAITSLCATGGTLSAADDESVNKSSLADSKAVRDKLELFPIPSSGGVEHNRCENSQVSSPIVYCTVGEADAARLPWPAAYYHKFHGIHYNRSKAVEEYENLTIKLCERYIGAETQSTCNVWFSKHTPGSARKRSLLGKRETGQSPGKRLNHLARRRRTFSSANLQGLGGLADKKQLVLNVRKVIVRKGKSPRGKSPRGSAKKRGAVRRLALDGPSPRKAKLETSKRALFQSPPSERVAAAVAAAAAGPSKATNGPGLNPQKIKRALFPTPKKKRDGTEPSGSFAEHVFAEETRKRRREDDGSEDLNGPRSKWAKSLSFDCTHEFEKDSNKSWERGKNSSGHVFLKAEATANRNRNELSDTHRKKLLWAVAEALRGKGIGMSHPRFKQYASSLARTVKKFMPDLENRNIPRKAGSTSDRMLKLAKHHALFIIDDEKTL